jgi:hypothetical protein
MNNLEIKIQSEDGSNYVHLMLDNAIRNVVENGCDGVKFADE